MVVPPFHFPPIPVSVIISGVSFLYKAVNDVWKENSKFQSNLDNLRTTLASLKSTLDVIESANNQKILAFRNPNNVVGLFVERLEKGNELVSKCSKFHPLDFVGKYFHDQKLFKLNEELIKFHQSEMLAEVLRDNKLILSEVQSLHQKVDRLLVLEPASVPPFSKLSRPCTCTEMLILIGFVVGVIYVIGVISPSGYSAMEMPPQFSKLLN